MATRKEDKLRPYRVDYFDIEEMKENDLALVRSLVVRAVTADEAVYEVLCEHEFSTDYPGLSSHPYPSLVIIRSYRYYKNLVHKKDVYKPVEDLFTANKAVEVMEQVEAYRAKKAATPQPAVSAVDPTPVAPVLEIPAEAPAPAPTTGPDSPATKAVVADLQGMISHDAHEQAMDNFTPTDVPEGKRFPDPTNIPITAQPLIEPDQAVGTNARPEYLNVPPPPQNVSASDAPPLMMKIFGFSAALLLLFVILKLLFCHH